MIEFNPEQVLRVRRLAVRENGDWRWFNEPLYTTFGDVLLYQHSGSLLYQLPISPMHSDILLEADSKRAVAQYAIKDIRLVEAPSKEGMEKARLEDLI